MKKKVFKILLTATGAIAVMLMLFFIVWSILTSETILSRSAQKAFYENIHPGLKLELQSPRFSLAFDFTVSGGSIVDTEKDTVIAKFGEAIFELNPWLLLTRGSFVPDRVTIVDPELQVHYLSDREKWDWEEYLAEIELDEPRFRELLRNRLHIENGRVDIVAEHMFGDNNAREIHGINVSVGRKSFTRRLWNLTGYIHGGALNGTVLSGHFGPDNLNLYARFGKTNVDAAFMAFIPLGHDLEELLEPRGIAHGEFELDFDKIDGTFSPSWRGLIQAESMKAKSKFYPVQTEGVSGEVEIVGHKVNFRNITGYLHPEDADGKVKANFRVRGKTDLDEKYTRVNIVGKNLPLTEKLLRYIPDYGEEVWEKLQASGRANMDLTVFSRENGDDNSFIAEINPENAGIAPHQLPWPIDNLHGKLLITDKGIQFHDLTGEPAQGEGHATIRLNGKVSKDGIADNLQVRADALKFDSELLKHWPEIETKKLDVWNPEGTADLTFLLNGDLRSPQNLDYRGDVIVRNTGIKLPDLPFPIEQLEGRVNVCRQNIQLADISFRMLQDKRPVRVTLNGLLNRKGDLKELHAEFKDFYFDKDILVGFPEFEYDKSGFWDYLKPAGLIDGEFFVSGKQWETFSATLNVKSGVFHPPFSPLPVKDISAKIHLTEDFVNVANLTGAVEGRPFIGHPSETQPGTFVSLRGKYRPENEKGRFNIEIEDFNLTPDLVRQLPEKGRSLWEKLSLQGLMSVGVSVETSVKENTEIDVTYQLGTELKNATLKWDRFPVLLSSVSGNVYISNDYILAPKVYGIACGGKIELWGGLSGLESDEDIRYDGTVDFQRLDLRKLIRELTGRELDVSGKLQGELEIAGRLGDKDAIEGQGQISLSEGRIWKVPVFMGLIDILHLSRPGATGNFDRGYAQYIIEDDVVHVQHFELRSPAAELTGWGSIDLETEELDLEIVAATVAEGGVPVISPALKTLLAPVQRELIRIHITGPVRDPNYSYTAIGRLTGRTIDTLHNVITFPFRIFSSDE